MDSNIERTQNENRLIAQPNASYAENVRNQTRGKKDHLQDGETSSHGTSDISGISDKKNIRGTRPMLTLVIAFYNKIDYLKLIFASLEMQTMTDFEVIIADDGSRPEIQQQLHELTSKVTFPVLHLWQEDLGFRKNRMLNWAIHHARADYMVFIDADCVLHPEFLREHFEHRVKNSILAGRRMDLNAWVTGLLTVEKIRQGFLWKNYFWIALVVSYMKDNNAPKGIYISERSRFSWLSSLKKYLRRLVNRKPREVVGCNFSCFREDLLKVNGFDTRFTMVSFGEDSEIEFRMKLAGIQTIPFCNTAVQYHLYHKVLPRPEGALQLFLESKARSQAVTDHGLQQMLQSDNYRATGYLP
jgi:glycosyltransferase involved in cell wall biosynthesis